MRPKVRRADPSPLAGNLRGDVTCFQSLGLSFGEWALGNMGVRGWEVRGVGRC